MPYKELVTKRSSAKKPSDLNRLAGSMVEEVTKEPQPTEAVQPQPIEGKNPHSAREPLKPYV